MRPPVPGFHWRIWAAEATGTGLMVLAIVAAASLALGRGSPVAEALPGRGAGFFVLGAIVAPCVALIAVSPLGRLSGAHINPAVTFGFWSLGRVCPHDLVGYVGAQLLGGLAGAYLARLLLPRSVIESIGGAVTHPDVPLAAAVALEAGMTALLLAVVFLFVSVARLARWTPLALVPLLTAIIWLGSPWTGASLNPARSEGPAVAFGDLSDLWLYCMAPVIGALAVGLVWRRLSMRPKTAKLFHDPSYPCTFATELPVTDDFPVFSAVPTPHTPMSAGCAASRSPSPRRDAAAGCNAARAAATTPQATDPGGVGQMPEAAPVVERTPGLRGLKDKNVLVTGGSSGIGQAIAVRFAEYGSNVAINYLRKPDEAKGTEDQVQACVAKVQREGVRDVLVQGDVSKEDDVVAMVGDAVEQLGGLDVLVNNAGIQISRPSDELSSEDFDKVIAVNLRGSFMCAREAIRHYLAEEKPGVIINISSVHQIIPKPDYLGYSASKGGMQNMTRTLALEYAGRGIRVNGVGPGATVTPINRAWIDDPEKRKEVEEHIPMQRAGDADEMAGVTAFLASDDAAYITGQTIFVDGGLTLFPSFATPWSSE